MYPLRTHLCVIFLASGLSSALWPFGTRRFTSNSLINAGSLGLDSTGRVIAFGDFDGDQSLDVLTLDAEQKTITVCIWNHEKFIFQPSITLRHQQLIRNAVPGDFNNDGRLDLLVMNDASRGEIAMSLYFSSSTHGFDAAIEVPSSTSAQPFLIDSNGDMKIDLLGASSLSDQPIALWKNVWNETNESSEIFRLTDPLFQGGVPCSVSSPHSNAFVDLDGDCLADIFLMCQKRNSREKSFQIWLNSPERNGFHMGLSGQLPEGVGPITFADMDRDGTIDMVFPTCKSIDSGSGIGRNCYLNIVYNKQRPLCKSSPDFQKKNDCRLPGNLCTKDPDFHFDFSEDNNDGFVRIDLGSFSPFNALLMSDITYNPPLPVAFRVGDLNLDGYPDVIVIGVSESGNRTPYILNSVQCSNNIAGCGSRAKGRRGFQVAMKGTEIMRHVVDARGVAVLDLDEDGTLDILIQRTGSQGEGTIAFIQNNFFFDAFFLKAMVMNRPCDGVHCGNRNSSVYDAYGVSYPGATYKYTVQDTSGRRSAAQVPQLPQTSYHSLHTPYSFFGLGRTNNYIENLFVGSTKRQDTFINMEGVIPNSKVIITPSSPGENVGWKKELFLRPGAWIPWVTLTLVVSTAVLAIIVLFLHFNEKREDELERRRASHHINFDAL